MFLLLRDREENSTEVSNASPTDALPLGVLLWKKAAAVETPAAARMMCNSNSERGKLNNKMHLAKRLGDISK